MLTLFNHKKIYKYTEEQHKAIADGIEKLFQDCLQSKEECNKALSSMLKAIRLLARIRQCYPHVFDECVNPEELKSLADKI